MACLSPFDVMRIRAEDLGPTLHLRASYLDPWMNLIPRGEYPQGAGLERSTFTIGRSFPETDEETWAEITVTDGENFTGSCGTDYAQVYVGFKEVTYKPEEKGLVGPPVCQDSLPLYWMSDQFWGRYFESIEKRNTYTITNRLANIYMNYVPKAIVQTGSLEWTDPGIDTQPPGSTVDLSDLDPDDSTCDISYAALQSTAQSLMYEGAQAPPDSNGWITHGDAGPIFPLLIGQEASLRIVTNNSEKRQDYRVANTGNASDTNPVIKRLGGTLVLGNWRHMVTLTPPRWKVVNGAFVRVPTYVMSTNAADATKGKVGLVNPDYIDPSIATHEGAIALNPAVYTEQVLRPMNTAPGQKWTPQNYFGEWYFVTGNDAFLGFDDCTGIKDPLHTLGRHFARYRHSAEPIFPQYGRLLIFNRQNCSEIDCVTCT